VTIPHEVTYRNLDRNRPSAGNTEASAAFNFCGCGWPQNMLIPKGSFEGYQCQLFVMISNGANDQVIKNKRLNLMKYKNTMYIVYLSPIDEKTCINR